MLSVAVGVKMYIQSQRYGHYCDSPNVVCTRMAILKVISEVSSKLDW